MIVYFVFRESICCSLAVVNFKVLGFCLSILCSICVYFCRATFFALRRPNTPKMRHRLLKKENLLAKHYLTVLINFKNFKSTSNSFMAPRRHTGISRLFYLEQRRLKTDLISKYLVFYHIFS